MRRLLMAATVAAAFAVPAGLVLTSSPASAASSVTCKKLSGTITGTITISKCTPKAPKGEKDKTLSGQATGLATGGSLTWSPSGKTTTVGKPVTTSPGQGKCPTGWTEYISSGTVTGGTATYTHAGDTFSSDDCVNNSTSVIAILKGTTANF